MRASKRAMATWTAALLFWARFATAAGPVAYNTYWGDLHGHTMDSPVTLTTATIDAYIRYARDTKGLNFVALTEKDFDLSDTEWSDSRSRAAAFTSSSFVAFSAFEWGDKGYGDFGHRPVYYLTDNQPLLRSDAGSASHVSGLLDAVLSTTNGFTSVAHPDLNNYLTDWDYVDGTCDRIAEIYSRHGHFETGTRGLQQALAQGLQFGFVAVSDTRTAQPGDYGLTAVLSSTLSKSALHAAIKARRTYATTGARILLQATMDGHQIGEEYTSGTGPTLAVTCTPTAAVTTIEVVKNNSVVYTYAPAGATPPSGSAPWRGGPVIETSGWTAAQFDDHAWRPASLTEELTAPRQAGGALRLRQTLHLESAPPDAILRLNLDGEYRVWLNGKLLVDTHTFQYDDPARPHDCNAPDAHELAGSPEYFKTLGFYDLRKLGGRLQAGDNVLALEYESRGPQKATPVVELVPMPAVAPVSFTWADGSFNGASFYYLRVTQADGQQAWSSPWWVNRVIPDTTPPQAPLRLRAHKDVNDVYLDWAKVTKDMAGNVESMGSYRIFRGTAPDFVPDRSGLTNQVGTATKARFRDTGALPTSPDYYYRVVAVDAVGNESPNHSNLAFKLHHPVTFHTGIANINWLSIPYQVVYTNADQLARDLNRGTSGPCTKVMRWDVATQRPVSWVYMGSQWTGTNFPLTPGEAIAIAVKQDMDAVLVGAHDDGSLVRLTSYPTVASVNWVSVPVNTPHQLAFQVVQDMNSGFFPGPVTRIMRLNPDLQTTQTYQWNGSAWSGTNFVVLPGEAFGVLVQTTTDWQPDTK